MSCCGVLVDHTVEVRKGFCKEVIFTQAKAKSIAVCAK